jgi:hypothetical protein
MLLAAGLRRPTAGVLAIVTRVDGDEARQSGGAEAMSRIGSTVGRLLRLPLDLAETLRALPSIAQHTAQLGEAVRLLTRIADDTEGLLPVRRDMARVAEATSVLKSVEEGVGSIEEAMPVLIEVQRHLNELPETIGGLGEGIEQLSAMMQHMLASLDALGTNVEELRGAVAPVGRLANRMPRRRKRAQVND